MKYLYVLCCVFFTQNLNGQTNPQLFNLKSQIESNYEEQLALTDSVLNQIDISDKYSSNKIYSIKLLDKLINPKSTNYIINNFESIVYDNNSGDEYLPYFEVLKNYQASSLFFQSYKKVSEYFKENSITEFEFKQLSLIIQGILDPYLRDENILLEMIRIDKNPYNDYLLNYNNESKIQHIEGLHNKSQAIRDSCAVELRRTLNNRKNTVITGKNSGYDEYFKTIIVIPDSTYTGLWREYYTTGEIYREQLLVNAINFGVTNIYHDSGELKYSIIYDNGEIISKHEFDKNGKLLTKSILVSKQVGDIREELKKLKKKKSKAKKRKYD